jgi:hypothetical protein
MTEGTTVNREYEPTPVESAVLTAFKRERDETGESRMTPAMVGEHVDESRQTINYALGQLHAAGWVHKRATGIYEFVADPREDSDE